MPPCIAQVLHRTSTRIHRSRFSIRTKNTGRSYTTSTLQKGILTALHSTDTVLLSNVLFSSEATRWSKLIGTSSDILTGVFTRKPRVAVWSPDEHSQATELISALLDDPLVSDRRNIDVLRSRRRERAHNVLTIRYGELCVSTSEIALGLPWLQKLDVDIIEIPPTHPNFKTFLYDADIQLIVTSTFSPSLPRGLESLVLNPGSLLIFQHPTLDQRAVDLTLSRLTARSPILSDALKTKTLHIYPSRALSALDTFREASNSATAIQAFQDDFLNSGVTTLSKSISQALSLDQRVLKTRHAQRVLFGALEECRNSVEDASRDTAAVQVHVDELHMRIDEAHSRSVMDILGGEGAPHVAEAINRSTREMQVTMDALKWWKLPFKVDELGDMLSRAAERAWCRDLEAKLQFQTGRLSVLRSTLTAETHGSLDLIPSSFRSAVLVNTLHQISVRPPDLSPTTLTYPLEYRLRQLQYPILSLHRRAQRIVLAAVTTAFVSAGSTYAAWLLGWVTPPTAVGLGALAMMAGVRWLVGNWEKGKKRWWDDWRRVGEGLERDLKEMLAIVMQEKVAAVPITAAEELSKAVASRLSEVKEISDKLESLEESSRQLYSQQQHASTE